MTPSSRTLVLTLFWDVTELFTERMRERFNATVSHKSESRTHWGFATISNVQGLAHLVSGSAPQALKLRGRSDFRTPPRGLPLQEWKLSYTVSR